MEDKITIQKEDILSIEKMAKKANRRSRACNNCSLVINCNMATQKVCSDAFIEGFVKGYKQGKKG